MEGSVNFAQARSSTINTCSQLRTAFVDGESFPQTSLQVREILIEKHINFAIAIIFKTLLTGRNKLETFSLLLISYSSFCSIKKFPQKSDPRGI